MTARASDIAFRAALRAASTDVAREVVAAPMAMPGRFASNEPARGGCDDARQCQHQQRDTEAARCGRPPGVPHGPKNPSRRRSSYDPGPEHNPKIFNHPAVADVTSAQPHEPTAAARCETSPSYGVVAVEDEKAKQNEAERQRRPSGAPQCLGKLVHGRIVNGRRSPSKEHRT